MKKIVLALSVIASALVLASCASKGNTSMDQGAMASAPAQTATVSHHHRHDYKGEMNK
jgi:ABC-type glycerol-3-phosphate transport system substrate-binding protein